MKSVIYTLVAATALWLGGTFTSTADAQNRVYRGGYYAAPRYYRNYNYRPYYGPRYYSRGYYNYPYRAYRPYNGPYYGGYYGGPYYRGYYGPGVSVGVGPVGIRAGF